jgi:hypothetical protein
LGEPHDDAPPARLVDGEGHQVLHCCALEGCQASSRRPPPGSHRQSQGPPRPPGLRHHWVCP